jgi:hypothetical protein
MYEVLKNDLNEWSELVSGICSITKITDNFIVNNTIEKVANKKYLVDLGDLQNIFMLISSLNHKLSNEIIDKIEIIDLKKDELQNITINGS